MPDNKYVQVPDLSDDFPSVELPNFPEIKHIDVAHLVIDSRYQRSIERKGRNIIRSMIETFDWSIFGVVVVAPISESQYAIIDGQHRTAALKGMGQQFIPCVVTETKDIQGQAASFIKINTNRSAMTPLQVFRAELAAEEPDALALQKLIAEAGGEIYLSNYGPASTNRVGLTNAIGSLKTLFKRDSKSLKRIYSLTVKAGISQTPPKLINGLFYLVTDKIYGHHCSDPDILSVLNNYTLSELQLMVSQHCHKTGDKRSTAWPLIIWRTVMDSKDEKL